MTVERIKKLDINNRPIFTGLYGYSFGDEYFIEENLCKYSFTQELYRYLRSEGFTTLFYNTEFNFFSYEESQLETFFFKKPEEILYENNSNSSCTSRRRFVAPIASPNGHNRRRGIRLKSEEVQKQSNAQHNTKAAGFDCHEETTERLVSHRPNSILVHRMENDSFFQLKSSEDVLKRIFSFIDNNPGHKLAVVFTMPSEISFDIPSKKTVEAGWLSNLQKRYSDQHYSGTNLRLIVSYDTKDVVALYKSFESFKNDSRFFFKEWFKEQLFPNHKGEETDLYKPSDALFHVDRWGRDEVCNVLKRRRVMEGLQHTLAPIPFDDLSLRIWQQFTIKKPGTKKDIDIETVKDLMGLPTNVLDAELQKMDNEKAIDKLKKLRGIDEIIAQFERYIEDLINCQETGETFRKHMVFMGNPGTGKTTVARIFADILREKGVLETGRLHQVTAADLISQFVGHTRIKTQEVCLSARGGVLFIDEAYGLFQSGSADSKTGEDFNQYGREAIEILQQFMENDNTSLVIMAGYPEEMDDFLKNGNIGFDSRIGEQGRFEFKDYEPNILLEIALAQLKGEKYTEQFKQKLNAIFTVLHRFKDKKWANARTAENTISKIKSNYRSKRLTGPYDVDAIPAEYMRLIQVFTSQEEMSITKELDDMIGLEKVKAELHRIFNESSSNRILLEKLGEIDQDMPDLTFVFEGNPGTGKTTVARLMGKILAGYGLLLSPEVKEYSKSSIVSSIRGGSVRLVNQMFDECIGKVLFIDEAYTLANQEGKEAVDQIVQNMTLPKYQGKIAIILAGYPSDMSDLMNINDGIESRFSTRLHFEDYTNEQLTQMYIKYVEKEGKMLAEGCKEKIFAWFCSQNRDDHFGNGRLIKKKLHKEVKALMGKRFRNDTGNHDDNYYKTIFPEDIPGTPEASQYIVDVPEEAHNNSTSLQQSHNLNPKVLPFDKDELLESLKSVKGQQDNVRIIAEEINTWIKDAVKEAPLVFMLAGTSGTGKTFTAETINAALKDYRMVKLNMNEYSSEADSWKLLGSSSGYIGSDEDSPIFAARRETPNLLILFDEIEKAHPSLFTTIMTLMEKGEMGNGHGEVFDFKQSIIVFTTNLAMKELLKLKKESIQNNTDPSSPKFQDAARDILKAAGLKDEISGRVTWVLVYNTLDAPMVAQIAMEKIRKLGNKYGIKINTVHKAYLEEIAKQCADNNEGARPINRMVTRKMKPIFQKACESDECNPTVLYDIDEHFQIIPSSSSDIIPVESLNYDLNVNASESNTDNEPVVIKLSSSSFFDNGYNYESYRKAIGLIELDNGNSGTGSGFLISQDGYILTCAHCTEAKKIVFVKDDDKKKFEANVVYKNELIDIAVLKIDVSNMPYLSISDSVRPLKIGTEIVILGYPSGTDVSENVSAFEGKVSNFIGGIKSYITDAIAAPGSSGGALIAKKDGKVYGVLRGGYKETLGVDINASSDIRDLFKQDDIIIEYI